MKKIIIFVITLFYAINISASIVVMDADSGRILYSQNKDERKLIASTTKIMTTLIALENSDIKKEVIVKDEILKVNGSMIYSKINEKYTIEDLLYGLMLRSGNDAAMTIATNVLGYDNFINTMNINTPIHPLLFLFFIYITFLSSKIIFYFNTHLYYIIYFLFFQ